MNKAYATLAAAFLLSVSGLQAQACTTNTPLSVWGQNGSNGLLASTGTENSYDAGSVVGQITNDFSDLNGTANLSGTADCSAQFSALNKALREAQHDTAALAAALSTPVWLEAGEQFAISGGLGFSDGATALGATGLLRLDKNWSAFAGGAFSTDNSSFWSGKVGARVGW